VKAFLWVLPATGHPGLAVDELVSTPPGQRTAYVTARATQERHHCGSICVELLVAVVFANDAIVIAVASGSPTEATAASVTVCGSEKV
jgi:hypothetical protein